MAKSGQRKQNTGDLSRHFCSSYCLLCFRNFLPTQRKCRCFDTIVSRFQWAFAHSIRHKMTNDWDSQGLTAVEQTTKRRKKNKKKEIYRKWNDQKTNLFGTSVIWFPNWGGNSSLLWRFICCKFVQTASFVSPDEFTLAGISWCAWDTSLTSQNFHQKHRRKVLESQSWYQMCILKAFLSVNVWNLKMFKIFGRTWAHNVCSRCQCWHALFSLWLNFLISLWRCHLTPQFSPENVQKFAKNDLGGTRTHNLWLRRPTPSPLGHKVLVAALVYQGVCFVCWCKTCWENCWLHWCHLTFCGRFTMGSIVPCYKVFGQRKSSCHHCLAGKGGGDRGDTSVEGGGWNFFEIFLPLPQKWCEDQTFDALVTVCFVLKEIGQIFVLQKSFVAVTLHCHCCCIWWWPQRPSHSLQCCCNFFLGGGSPSRAACLLTLALAWFMSEGGVTFVWGGEEENKITLLWPETAWGAILQLRRMNISHLKKKTKLEIWPQRPMYFAATIPYTTVQWGGGWHFS